MDLGIVSDSDFEKALNRVPSVGSAINGVIKTPQNGRPLGRLEVPDIARRIIGDTAIESGRKDALEIAKLFDVSDSSVSAYSNGATSTANYNKPAEGLGQHIAKTKERISKKAANLTKRALNKIDDEKLDALDGVQLIQVARSASAIVKDMEPPVEKGPINNGVQFVIQAPRMAKEESFEVIQVNE